MKKVLLLLLCLMFSGCISTANNKDSGKFTRIFTWGFPDSEANAYKYYLAGTTDIRVRNKKELNLAKKYNMSAYCGTFTPVGPHPQVMTAEEQLAHNYINALDLPKSLSRAERRKIIVQRQREKDHRFGGESSNPLDTINTASIACFSCDTDFKLSKAKMDKILDNALPGVSGVYMDYIGYTNHRGCYCANCLERCQAFLKTNKLSDTQENRERFYRDELVKYYNAMVNYVKSRRPDFKVVAHFYPDFRPEPFYGNRTAVDFGGHTVAWYFKAPLKKISAETRHIYSTEKLYHRNIKSIPFLGLNTNANGALGYKTPEEVDAELQMILSAGGTDLMVCSGISIIRPGYFEVFKKYSRHSN